MRSVQKAKNSKTLPAIQSGQIIDSILNKISPNCSDVVLFLGASSTQLIFKCLSKAKKVIVMEENINLVSELQRNILSNQGKERIEVINAKIESAVLPYFNLCVINTSFSLVTPLLFKMILHAEPFRYVYAFCMRDLALSIAAKCSEEHYSRISINMQLFCKTSEAMKIKGSNFSPAMKVDVTLLRIQKRKSYQNLKNQLNFSEWDGLTRICFTRKNKTLLSLIKQRTNIQFIEHNYRSYCSLNEKVLPEDFNMKSLVQSVVEECGFSSKRVKDMNIEDFLKLLLAFNEKGIHFA